MNNESESVIKYFGFDDLNKLIQIEKGDDDLNQLYFKYLSVNKTIPKNVLTIIIKHLLKGIEFITLKGIIHGDIKMENVVIIMIKTCKIIDFDLSQDIKAANLHSIEELSNSFLYEDLYCVGKIMCLLLSTTQKKISICNGTSLLIPYGLDITKNCLELLIALLKENPNKRISITNAMKSPYIVSDDDYIKR